MAVKKRKHVSKRTASRKPTKAKKGGLDNDFMIISGGGLIIIVIALAFVYGG
jgi:hypothetical protein